MKRLLEATAGNFCARIDSSRNFFKLASICSPKRVWLSGALSGMYVGKRRATWRSCSTTLSVNWLWLYTAWTNLDVSSLICKNSKTSETSINESFLTGLIPNAGTCICTRLVDVHVKFTFLKSEILIHNLLWNFKVFRSQRSLNKLLVTWHQALAKIYGSFSHVPICLLCFCRSVPLHSQLLRCQEPSLFTFVQLAELYGAATGYDFHFCFNNSIIDHCP